MKHTYNTWSYKVFEGFYESNLFNSDNLLDIEYTHKQEGYLKENQSYDIDNFQEFKKDVADNAVYELFNTLANNDIIKSMKLKDVYSPKYYNFETDSLIIKMDINLRALKTFCFKTNKDMFNKYLKENFTSYDGFLSFVDNNIKDFINTYKTTIDKNREINVMIEYYLLTQINNTLDCDNFDCDNSYQYSIYEYANESLYNHLKVVDSVA